MSGINNELKEIVRKILCRAYPQQSDSATMDENAREIESAITRYQPELLWEISAPAPLFNVIRSSNSIEYLKGWLNTVEQLINQKNISYENAIDNFITEFDQILLSKRLTLSITAPLLGMRLEEGVDVLLDHNILIKAYPEDKKRDLKEKSEKLLIAGMGFPPRSELIEALGDNICTCVYGEFSVPYDFVSPEVQPFKTLEVRAPTVNVIDEFNKACQLFLFAAHVVKGGFSEVFFQSHELKLKGLFPRLRGGVISERTLRPAWQEITINSEDSVKIAKIYSYLQASSVAKPKIYLACRRLFVSESRAGSGGVYATTDADRLIDACIGIESVLVPPGTRGNLTKIILQNYCRVMQFSGATAEREKTEIKEKILQPRGKVVHGGMLDDEMIKRAGELAQTKLRKLISAIVLDHATLTYSTMPPTTPTQPE